MICTFGDTADVTWWRELDLPARSIVGWDGRLLADAPDARGRGLVDAALDAYASLAGKTVKQAQQQIVELLRESGDLVGEPKPITHAVKFYEKGDRPLEIVTTRQWYLTNGGRDPELAAALRSARRRARLAPAAHEGALRALGRRPQRRLAHQPPALLRRAVPGLVPPRRAGRPRLRRPPAPHRGRASGRPVERRPRRLHRRPAWQGGRVHRRPRRHGHVGHVVAHPADRVRMGGRRRPLRPHVPDGPPAAGPRDHPHVAVRHRGALAPRARRPAVERHHHQRLDPRPRPQEDVEEQGQRWRHADVVARAVRIRRGAVLGGERASRRRHRVRRRPDEDRAPAVDQDPQRVEVRARRDGRRRDPDGGRDQGAARPVVARAPARPDR